MSAYKLNNCGKTVYFMSLIPSSLTHIQNTIFEKERYYLYVNRCSCSFFQFVSGFIQFFLLQKSCIFHTLKTKYQESCPLCIVNIALSYQRPGDVYAYIYVYFFMQRFLPFFAFPKQSRSIPKWYKLRLCSVSFMLHYFWWYVRDYCKFT